MTTSFTLNVCLLCGKRAVMPVGGVLAAFVGAAIEKRLPGNSAPRIPHGSGSTGHGA
jgi:hypothetical protein